MSYRNGQEKYLDTSAKNYLLNGNFDFWQRGNGPTAGNGSGVYLADRWIIYANAGLSTVQKVAGYNDGSGATNSALITFNSGDADVAFMQPLETLVSKPLQSKTVTFSVYLKKGGTFVDNVNISIRQSNDVDSRFLPTGQTVTLVTIPNSSISTTNFTRFSVTATILSGSSQVAVLVATDPTVNGSTLEVRQAMLNEGPIAAPFQRAGANIAEELAICQRYYEKSYSVDVAPGTNTQVGMHVASSNTDGVTSRFTIGSGDFKVTKRAIPDIAIYAKDGTFNRMDQYNNVTVPTSGPTVTGVAEKNQSFVGSYIQASTTGWPNAEYYFHWTASAEL